MQQKELVKDMKSLYRDKTPFYQAQKQLLAKGYDRSDIIYALYTVGYADKLKDEFKERTRAHFAANPAMAYKIGDLMLRDVGYHHNASEKVENLLHRFLPLTPAQAFIRFALKDSDEPDFPFFTMILSILLSTFFVIKHRLPEYGIAVGPAIVLVYWHIVSRIGPRT